jgi:hypothetical protein
MYNILILCWGVLWPAIDSAPGGHTDMRPVSLKPEWPGEGTQGKKFCERWPVAKWPQKHYAINAFLMAKFLLYIFAVLYERDFRLVFNIYLFRFTNVLLH